MGEVGRSRICRKGEEGRRWEGDTWGGEGGGRRREVTGKSAKKRPE